MYVLLILMFKDIRSFLAGGRLEGGGFVPVDVIFHGFGVG